VVFTPFLGYTTSYAAQRSITMRRADAMLGTTTWKCTKERSNLSDDPWYCEASGACRARDHAGAIKNSTPASSTEHGKISTVLCTVVDDLLCVATDDVWDNLMNDPQSQGTKLDIKKQLASASLLASELLEESKSGGVLINSKFS